MDEETVPVARAAVVTAGFVENVIIVATSPEDGEFALEGSEIILLAEDSEVGIGWLWDGEEFHSPPDSEE